MKSTHQMLLITLVLCALSAFALLVSAIAFGVERAKCIKVDPITDVCKNYPIGIGLCVTDMFLFMVFGIFAFITLRALGRACRAAVEFELYGAPANAGPAVTA